MPYFDGRESGLTDDDLRRVREIFTADAEGTRTYFTGQDVEIEPLTNSDDHVVVGSKGDRHLYPRVPTEDLAREMYLNGDLTDAEFEHVVGQALEHEGVGWGD